MMFLTWTRFATPGIRVMRRSVGRGGVLTWLLTIAGVQNNAWPLIGFAVALNDYSRLWSSRSKVKDERGTTRRGFDARTKFNFQLADQIQNTRPQPNTSVSVTCSHTNVLGKRLGCPGTCIPLCFETTGHRTKERCCKRAF